MKFLKKMNKGQIVAIIIVAIVIYMYRHQLKQMVMPASQTYGDGDYTIYGSMKCPWTVKAVEHAKKNGHAYNYVDCKEGKCPDFVNGFPTYKNHTSGNVKSGFTETPHDI